MPEITIGTLFTNNRGDMFTVYLIKNYKYKEVEQTAIIYYPISDSGLINKTKERTCKLSDLENKFTLLNWKF